ncbi:MAG: divergent polysaccharide deacetylase family protein, partial [Rhodospirillales bacterium]
NNHMGSKFTEDRYGMTIVMKELRRRGLLFLDSRTTGKSVGAVIAHAVGVPYAERNIFLDNVNNLGEVRDRLAELEGIARRKGEAIAIGHPRDATIEALTAWLKDIKARGFVIVPITAVIHIPKLAG